jgi:hypothetical protein
MTGHGREPIRRYSSVVLIRYRARLEVIFNGHPVRPSEYWHTDT